MVGVAGGGGVMAAAGMLKGRVVVALYTYQGSEFGDMTFSKGDQMEIVDDTDPDWCDLLHSLNSFIPKSVSYMDLDCLISFLST